VKSDPDERGVTDVQDLEALLEELLKNEETFWK